MFVDVPNATQAAARGSWILTPGGYPGKAFDFDHDALPGHPVRLGLLLGHR